MKFKYIIILFIYKLLFFINIINSSCIYTDGFSVDVSAIQNFQFSGTTTTGNDYIVYFNLCSAYPPGCTNAGSNLYACQVFSSSTVFGIGSYFNYPTFTDYGIRFSYYSPGVNDCTRYLYFDLYCDPSATSTSPSIVQSSENPTCTYNAKAYSSRACKTCTHLNNCNGHGDCVVASGKCSCTDQATGTDCSQSRLSISTVSSTTVKGGQVTITGYFGTTSASLNVAIGGIVCTGPVASSSQIICTIAAGEGQKDVVVTDKGLSATKLGGFSYTFFDCGNKCDTIHGSCDIRENICICDTQTNGTYCTLSRLSISTITSTTVKGGQVTITGYFGTTTDSLKVTIGGVVCSNPVSTSIQIICNIPGGEGQKDVIITDNGLTSPTLINGFTYQYFDCNNSCDTIHGSCDIRENICICDDQTDLPSCSDSKLYIDSVTSTTLLGGDIIINGYFGTTHSLQVLIGEEICNIKENTSITIKCYLGPGEGTFDVKIQDRDLNITLKDGFTYQACNPKCNDNHGECDGYQCNCDTQSEGQQCEKSRLFISSASITNVRGGRVFLSGYFGNITSLFKVIIGDLNCENVQQFNYTTISCNIGGGSSGLKDITIRDNDLSFTGHNIFRYQNIDGGFSCPNNCSKNGICNLNNGTCSCFDNFIAYDCSAKLDPENQSIPKINETTGESLILNQNLVFKLNIISLVEYSIDNSILKEYALNNFSNIKSTVINRSNNQNENTKILFSQFISEANCTVEYMIEEVVRKKKDYEFAGVSFTVDPGSLKVTISILNYNFMNSLSTLQLRIKSNVINEDKQQPSDCNSKDLKINSDQLENSESNFNYINISKDSKNVLHRFVNRIIADNRITPIKTTIISITNQSEIVLGINLNHAKSIIFDPDFSLVLANDFKDNCDSSNSRLFISISVVLSLVGVVVIIIVGAIIYKKYYLGLTIFGNKIKLNSIEANQDNQASKDSQINQDNQAGKKNQIDQFNQ